LSPRIGNKQSIELLRYWLDQAEHCNVAYIALVAVKNLKETAYDYAGAYDCEEVAQETLRELGQELEAIYRARNLGERNLDLSGACVEWPLSGVCPHNWDFLNWLVDAEMTRVRLGAPAPLRVAFSKEELLTDSTRAFWKNVMRPLVGLVGGMLDNDAIGGRHKRAYMTGDIVVAARKGETVPRLAATRRCREIVASHLHGVEPVTITLREANYLPWRNSNLEAWTHFARDLESKGQPVVIVRDTAKAMEPIDGFATFPRAAFDVDIRLALYEQAKANLFISNGPGSLAWFSDRPYLYLVNLKPETQDDYEPNEAQWWYGATGISVGEQWPWATANQRLVWKTDTYENINEAWEELCTS